MKTPEEIFILLKHHGSMSKVASYLNSIGERSHQKKSHKGYTVRAIIDYWIVRNQEEAKKWFPHISNGQWKKIVMIRAARMYHNQRNCYTRWLIENPWATESQYYLLRAFYYSEEELDAIRKCSGRDPSFWWEMCKVQPRRIRNSRTRSQISNKELGYSG